MGNENVLSKAANFTILNDTFTGHKTHFGNETVHTATSPHYIIIFNKGNAQMIQECEVKVGDIMCFEYEKYFTVAYIKEVQLDGQVKVEVENCLMCI